MDCFKYNNFKGVHIGKGSVIAAGSIVTKNIPPYSIAYGSPINNIKPRFSEKNLKLHIAKLDRN